MPGNIGVNHPKPFRGKGKGRRVILIEGALRAHLPAPALGSELQGAAEARRRDSGEASRLPSATDRFSRARTQSPVRRRSKRAPRSQEGKGLCLHAIEPRIPRSPLAHRQFVLLDPLVLEEIKKITELREIGGGSKFHLPPIAPSTVSVRFVARSSPRESSPSSKVWVARWAPFE